MPWFQSSKEKQLRLLVQDKMTQCLTKPERYQQSLRVLDSYTRASNQKVIEMVVDNVKQTIKDEDVQPMRKYQAILLLSDLMKSHNKALGKYVVKKILKRLTILAQHKKNQKDQSRGKDIFPKTKNKQQTYGAKFLTTLLLAIQDWGKNWPRSADGPFRDFESAYNELIMGRVQFPVEAKKAANRQSLPKPYNNSPQNKNQKPSLMNPPTSKQIVEKKRQPLPQYMLDYFEKLIEALKTLAELLNSNPEFSEMWAIIQSVIIQIKSIIQQGDSIVAQLLSNGEQNPQIFQKLQQNQNFLKQMEKDVRIVNAKNEKYPKFRVKYLKRSNHLITIFQIYFSDRSNSQSKVKENSENQKSSHRNISPQPKIQQIQPKIKVPNRYDSTSNLQQQMKLGHISIKKQDFNSNSHSDHNTSRYNSIGDRIKMDSERQKQKKLNNQEVKHSQEKTDNKQINQSVKNEQKTVSVDKGPNKTNMSKISEKFIESQQDFGAFGQEVKNQAPSQIFNEFSIEPKEKQDNSNSNSDFFKEIDNKQSKIKVANVANPRAPRNIKKKPQNDFFNASINNQVDSSELSAFKKSQKSKISSVEISRKEQIDSKKQIEHSKNMGEAFDTFKNPNAIQKQMSDLQRRQSQISENPFQQNSKDPENSVGNPFETQPNERGMFENNSDSKSKSSNPFSSKNGSNNNESFKGKISEKGVGIFGQSQHQPENPFDSKQHISNKSISSSKSHKRIEDNPFNTSIISNPFQKTVQNSQNDNSMSKNKSFETAKIKVEHKENFDINDPFEVSQNYNNISKDRQKSIQIERTNEKEKQQKINTFLRDSVQGFNLQDFGAMDENSRSQRSSEDQEKSRQFEAIEKGKKSEEKIIEKQSKQNFDDFFWENRSKDSKPSSKKQSQDSKKQKKQFDFEDFGNWDNKSNNNSKSFEKKNMFGSEFNYSQSKKSQGKIEFGLSDFENFQRQKSVMSNSSKNPFENQKPQIKISVQSANESKNKDGLYDWDNFGKQFQDKSSDQKKNFDQSEYQNSEEIEYQNQIKQNKSQQQQKSQKQQVQWEDFDKQQIKDSLKQSSQGPISQTYSNTFIPNNQVELPSLLSSQGDRKLQKNYLEEQNILKIDKQLESPFQRKQQPWSFQLSPGSQQQSRINNKYSSYHLEPVIQAKQKEAEFISQEHNKKLQKLQQLKTKLYHLRQGYKQQISGVGVAQQQRNDFKKILNTLRESNEAKEKQIQELIKKTRKADQIKCAILEKEKLLYQFVKQQKMQSAKRKERQVPSSNKWEKFNRNMQKLRAGQQQNNIYGGQISSYRKNNQESIRGKVYY